MAKSMNVREAYKRLQKDNSTNTDFGYVFIDDGRKESLDMFEKYWLDSMSVFNHFNIYDNWYLPFDISTHLAIYRTSDVSSDNHADYNYNELCIAVTFFNNEDHSRLTPIKFVAHIPLLGIVHGSFVMMTLAEVDHNNYLDDLRKQNPTDLIISSTINDDGDVAESLIGVTHLTKFVRKQDNTLRVMNSTIDLQKSEHISYDAYNDTVETISNVVISGFAYFTKLLINTRLFIVEERVAKEKKGMIKMNPDKPPLFHVIDIKTLRTRYIKRDSDDAANGIKIGYERRRHTRTFRSDYYKNKKGETIIINPTWVGATEWFDKEWNRFYKVRLDVG